MNFGFKNKSGVLFRVIFFIFLTIISFSNIYAAQGVPSTLSYQGKLTDSGGNPLGGGGTTYYFKFSLWDDATVGNGTQLWPSTSPNSTQLTVKQGSFSVNIGDTDNGYPDILDYDFNTNSKVYLQVEVSSDNVSFETLNPRSPISSTAFSQVANRVNGTADSSFGTTTPFASTLVSMLSTAINKAVLTIKGAVGQVANLFNILDSSGNTLFTVTSSGNVGVGTSTPGAKFTLGSGQMSVPVGTMSAPSYSFTGFPTTGMYMDTNVLSFSQAGARKMYFSSNINMEAPLIVSNTGTLTLPSISISGAGGTATGFYKPATDTLGFITGATERLRIDANGNVGIGTTSPSGKLNLLSTSEIFRLSYDPTNYQSMSVDSSGNLFIRKNSTSAIGLGLGGNNSEILLRWNGTAADGSITHSGSIMSITSSAAPLRLNASTVYTIGNLGIATTTPSAKLDVWGNLNVGTSSTPALFVNTATGKVVIGRSSTTSGTLEVYSNNPTSPTTQGVRIDGGGQGSYLWLAGGNQPLSTANKAGIVVANGNFSRGNMYFLLDSSSDGNNANITDDTKMMIDYATGNVGIGTTTPTQKLSVIGNAQITGVTSGTYAFDLNLTSDGTLTTSASDERLKTNIMLINSSSTLDKLSKLKPSTFDWKSDNSHDIGLIAQEVEQIFPELVFVNPTDDYKGINYSRFITLLISAIQELTIRISNFAKEFKTEKLCVGDTCITENELKTLLQSQNINSSTPTPVSVESTVTVESDITASSTEESTATTTQTQSMPVDESNSTSTITQAPDIVINDTETPTTETPVITQDVIEQSTQ